MDHEKSEQDDTEYSKVEFKFEINLDDLASGPMPTKEMMAAASKKFQIKMHEQAMKLFSAGPHSIFGPGAYPQGVYPDPVFEKTESLLDQERKLSAKLDRQALQYKLDCMGDDAVADILEIGRKYGTLTRKRLVTVNGEKVIVEFE